MALEKSLSEEQLKTLENCLAFTEQHCDKKMEKLGGSLNKIESSLYTKYEKIREDVQDVKQTLNRFRATKGSRK